MIQLIGCIGAISFSLCAVPQAWQCFKQGHAKGLSPLFLLLWGLGEVCMTIYVLLTVGWDIPLLSNYLFNFACLLVMSYYRFNPRQASQRRAVGK